MSAEIVILNEMHGEHDETLNSYSSLRERGMRLLAAVGVIAGLFAVATQHASGWQVPCKTVGYLATIPLVLVVLWIEMPRNMNIGGDLSKALDQLKASSEYSERDLALPIASALRKSTVANRKLLDRDTKWYQVAIFIALVQVVLWGLATIP